MRLDVILNTHDRTSAHPQPRFIQAAKQEITRTCTASLVASLRALPVDVEWRLRILDDHSTDETVAILKTYGEVIPLESRGYLQSIQGVLRLARASKADLVYMVEDDYLHSESAVPEAVEMHQLVSRSLPQNEIAVKVYDDANDYDPKFAETCQVLSGPRRHWKTCYNCCGTLLWTPRLMNHPRVVEWWDQISKLYMTKTGRLLNIHEGTTINRVWLERMALLLSPVPGLAAHLSDFLPPLFDWRTLWERHARAPAPPLIEAYSR